VNPKAARPSVVLLGPQAVQPTLRSVVNEMGYRGPIAAVTAGWQEWESDLAGLRSQLGPRVVPLPVYALAERIWSEDHELRDAHHRMQDDLREIRGLYARQLDRAAEAWMDLLTTKGPDRIVVPERTAALDAIHRLDAHHLKRIEEVQADFRDRMKPLERDAVARARALLLRELDSTGLVVIEGGHAAVLFNRIALFDLMDSIAERTVIGCGAGAMILCDRVVLYNDSPAIGRGNSEVGLPGFGLVPNVVVLPDATKRLRLSDAERMSRLALRVEPARCVLLDPGARLVWDGATLEGIDSVLVDRDGRLIPLKQAA
jgi:hypothetical protein